MSKLGKLLEIEERFTTTLRGEPSITTSESNNKIPSLLISCYNLNTLNNFLITDHAIVKIDIIIRSYKIRNPNSTIMVPLLVALPSDEFMERLDKLGVCRELKENIEFGGDNDSRFNKFLKLFSECYFKDMLKRKQIGFSFCNRPTYMLKMNLKRPYPSCLGKLRCDNIIIGAYVAFPEYVFGVTNIWMDENKTYGVYKMKHCNNLLIHSQGSALKNVFKLGYIESMDSLMNIQGGSLMGHSVSFGGSKSDKLFILPSNLTSASKSDRLYTPGDVSDLIVASVPSQEEVDYKSWENLGKRDDQWSSYKDHCEPVPFLTIPQVGYFPSLYTGPNHTLNRSQSEFINSEEIWDILHNNVLPERKIINNDCTQVTLLLDDCFDCNFLKGFFQLKLRSTRKPSLQSFKEKIVNWLIRKNIGLPMVETPLERFSTQLVFFDTERAYPIMNDEQCTNLHLEEEFLYILKQNLGAFLVLLFKALEKNSVDYFNEGHPFTEYLKADHIIWKDLSANLIHYQLTSGSSSKHELIYDSVFPRLNPTINFPTETMTIDSMRMEIQNMEDIKRRLIDSYSASALRMTIVNGMHEEPSFDRSVANSCVLSLHKFLEMAEVNKSETNQCEEMDEIDNIFVALSSVHLLQTYSAYSAYSFRKVIFEGWFLAQTVLNEYVNRKNLIKKSPNNLLIKHFLKIQLRVLNPIIPAFTSYCWNELLGFEESIEIYESIPAPDSKYVIADHLIREVLRRAKSTKKKYTTAKIGFCKKKQDWHLKALWLLKTNEDKILSDQGCMTEIVKYVKEHLNEFPNLKRTCNFINALIELYKEIGAEIFNDWDEHDLVQPHIEWISEKFKSSGNPINFYLEESSRANPFFPDVILSI